jgi:hypothetical protein
MKFRLIRSKILPQLVNRERGKIKVIQNDGPIMWKPSDIR